MAQSEVVRLSIAFLRNPKMRSLPHDPVSHSSELERSPVTGLNKPYAALCSCPAKTVFERCSWCDQLGEAGSPAPSSPKSSALHHTQDVMLCWSLCSCLPLELARSRTCFPDSDVLM